MDHQHHRTIVILPQAASLSINPLKEVLHHLRPSTPIKEVATRQVVLSQVNPDTQGKQPSRLLSRIRWVDTKVPQVTTLLLATALAQLCLLTCNNSSNLTGVLHNFPCIIILCQAMAVAIHSTVAITCPTNRI